VSTSFGAENPGSAQRLPDPLLRPFMKSQDQGASPSVYLATAPQIGGVTGRYFANRKAKESSPRSQLSTVACAHTRDEVATSPQEPVCGGRVLQEIADPVGALALGRQGSSPRASSLGPPRVDRYCAGHPIALKTATGSR
jgi:hypothetical protein